MNKETFVIYSNEESFIHDEPLFWSNVDGWVGLETATQFTEEERWSLRLPLGGKWMGIDRANNLVHNHAAISSFDWVGEK